MSKWLKEYEIGHKCFLFLKFQGTKKFRTLNDEYEISTFENKAGDVVSLYGTVKNSPIKLNELAIGDCVEVEGKIADFKRFGGTESTRISHVKIKLNKGQKKT